MTATQPPLHDGHGVSTTGVSHAPPAGWYDDPYDAAGKRYWDGSQWTPHNARPTTAMNAATPGPPTGSSGGGGLYGFIRRRPAVSLWSAVGVALMVGIALGAGSAQQEGSGGSNADSDRAADLSSQLDDMRSDLGSAQATLADTEEELADTKGKLSRTQDKLRDARAAAPPPAAAPVPPPADESESSGGSDSAKSFSGNGTKNIGTITVSEESVIEWTNDGELFIAHDEGFELSINSDAASGDTVLPPGTYKNVEVMALGTWTMEIRPR